MGRGVVPERAARSVGGGIVRNRQMDQNMPVDPVLDAPEPRLRYKKLPDAAALFGDLHRVVCFLGLAGQLVQRLPSNGQEGRQLVVVHEERQFRVGVAVSQGLTGGFQQSKFSDKGYITGLKRYRFARYFHFIYLS